MPLKIPSNLGTTCKIWIDDFLKCRRSSTEAMMDYSSCYLPFPTIISSEIVLRPLRHCGSLLDWWEGHRGEGWPKIYPMIQCLWHPSHSSSFFLSSSDSISWQFSATWNSPKYTPVLEELADDLPRHHSTAIFYSTLLDWQRLYDSFRPRSENTDTHMGFLRTGLCGTLVTWQPLLALGAIMGGTPVSANQASGDENRSHAVAVPGGKMEKMDRQTHPP